MKISGRLHKLHWKCYDLGMDNHMWLWTPICWITRTHKDNDCKDWNMGRTYCVFCDHTFNKDPWRIKRDQEKKHGSH